MGRYHTVQQGECLSSIAAQHGLTDYRKIYNHANNADFRQLRPNPNVIFPGDRIWLPDLVAKSVDRPVDASHRFVLKSPKVMLRLVVKDEHGNPRSEANYRLKLGNQLVTGKTLSNGLIEHQIPHNLERATLNIAFVEDRHTYRESLCLRLGHLDPVDTPSGQRARLINLGFGAKVENDDDDAIRRFQEREGLEADGPKGPELQARLKSLHGC